jgi:hypothetical protein
VNDSGGFYLEVARAGSKRWFWKFYYDGKEKCLSSGSYTRCVEAICGSADTFFTSAFSAQGKRQLSAYRNGEIKTLLAGLLGQEAIRTQGLRAAETARLFKANGFNSAGTTGARRVDNRASPEPPSKTPTGRGSRFAGTASMGFSFGWRRNAHPWRGTWGSPFGVFDRERQTRLGGAPGYALRKKAQGPCGQGLRSMPMSARARSDGIHGMQVAIRAEGRAAGHTDQPDG